MFCFCSMLSLGRVRIMSPCCYVQLMMMLLLAPLFLQFTDGTVDQERKVYIVYMGEAADPLQPGPRSFSAALDQHHKLLVTATRDESIAKSARIYSYTRSFNGFAARLLPEEVDRIQGRDDVISVFESEKKQLHTTRSWDFLGMTQDVLRKPTMESDIIIGVLDTGVYPDAPSFNDTGFGPPPLKWKGKCDSGPNFTGCNNKVIGARFYDLDYLDPDYDILSPADFDGHGSHTSSTAAGTPVPDASLYGIAKGTARGGVPSARIAMYKVCWTNGCDDVNLLAGFDDAIADGVDVISISIGGSAKAFHLDTIAIGSFHAMKKKIVVSCSAGNVGPSLGTVQNVAPWILTVAASNVDRQFKTAVKFANGMKSAGISLNTYTPERAMYPLTSGSLAATEPLGYGNASACDYGTLDEKKVKGKIIFCRGNANQDYYISKMKGAGVIMTTDELTEYPSTTSIPATVILLDQGEKIDTYINNTKYPRAVIYQTRTVDASSAAPAVASFSSRGPQYISPTILKPDVSAPGLSILAAYSKLTTLTGESSDTRHYPFNIISGTSMACPHAAAAAAYVKTFHPDWSPAMIKSAIMTTATPIKIPAEGEGLATGSGEINPSKAIHPGLVYDISISNYISYLCKEGYNETAINLLYHGRKNLSCSDFKPAQGHDGLNYPSMHLQLNSTDTNFKAEFYRTVKQVGFGNSVYVAKVTAPQGISVEVVPERLIFNRKHQKKKFKVTLSGMLANGTDIATASLVWDDSFHTVVSPIVVYKHWY
ncbi:Subtilisin-like protease SBT4.15 [Linum grandiflorum]